MQTGHAENKGTHPHFWVL